MLLQVCGLIPEMTNMAHPVQAQKPAITGENFTSEENQNSAAQYNPDAQNLHYVDKKDFTGNTGRQGKIEEAALCTYLSHVHGSPAPQISTVA
jgi:hypothetical protein